MSQQLGTFSSHCIWPLRGVVCGVVKGLKRLGKPGRVKKYQQKKTICDKLYTPVQLTYKLSLKRSCVIRLRTRPPHNTTHSPGYNTAVLGMKNIITCRLLESNNFQPLCCYKCIFLLIPMQPNKLMQILLSWLLNLNSV